MQIDIYKSGYRLSCIADNIRGQAALARENGSENFSCALDDLAEQIKEISWPMLEFTPDVALAVPVKLAVPLKTATQILAERAQEDDGFGKESGEAENPQQGQKIKSIEEFLQCDFTFTLYETAKILKVAARTFVRVLIAQEWIYRRPDYRLAASDTAIQNELMHYEGCRVTTKGVVEIAKILEIDPNIIVGD